VNAVLLFSCVCVFKSLTYIIILERKKIGKTNDKRNKWGTNQIASLAVLIMQILKNLLYFLYSFSLVKDTVKSKVLLNTCFIS